VKNIEPTEPPSMAEAETYWISLWGEEAQHNERAEWIRREEKRKIRYMDWRPIQIMEITWYLSKLTIRNLLEMIKYKITGLKLSQLLTGIPQKNFSVVVEEPEKAPDWLTTGITYLISKSGDTKKSETTGPLHVKNPNTKNSQKNFHTFGRAELTTSRAKRMSPWK